ncbi:MAG: type II toxin-antitoxin system RelE/ParE family toxin [Phycisphaerales bacterium]|nr:type II toxin-antitoxin system RelE/ParE family toxin [Phycisphaerales bacterium]
MTRVELTDNAVRDLASIHATIASQSPQNADSVLRHLAELMNSLAQFPKRGRTRSDLATGLRAIGVDSHMVFYTVRPHCVTILRVLHGSRDHLAAFRE